MNVKQLVLATCSTLVLAAPALANEELQKLSQDPAQWVMPSHDYWAQRHSTLDQINAGNVANMRPAWTFSTGVLRGHEGQPLVLVDVMYVHTAFPNNVFALDLNNDGRILWSYKPVQDPTVIPVMCCDTVNREIG